MRREKKHFD